MTAFRSTSFVLEGVHRAGHRSATVGPVEAGVSHTCGDGSRACEVAGSAVDRAGHAFRTTGGRLVHACSAGGWSVTVFSSVPCFSHTCGDGSRAREDACSTVRWAGLRSATVGPIEAGGRHARSDLSRARFVFSVRIVGAGSASCSGWLCFVRVSYTFSHRLAGTCVASYSYTSISGCGPVRTGGIGWAGGRIATVGPIEAGERLARSDGSTRSITRIVYSAVGRAARAGRRRVGSCLERVVVAVHALAATAFLPRPAKGNTVRLSPGPRNGGCRARRAGGRIATVGPIEAGERRARSDLSSARACIVYSAVGRAARAGRRPHCVVCRRRVGRHDECNQGCSVVCIRSIGIHDCDPHLSGRFRCDSEGLNSSRLC